MIPTWLASLFNGVTLTRAHTVEMFEEMFSGEMDPVRLTAALIAMKIRGEAVDEIVGAADWINRFAKPFPRPAYSIIDIVGTGGDGLNTINVSTIASIVVASLGVKVAKHGNRSASGSFGSSDLMDSLGINLQMSTRTARHCLDTFGLCYLFASHYHPQLKNIAAIRKSLGTRTIFNLVGPMVNPARPDNLLLGVYRAELVNPMAEALKMLGFDRAMVVHGGGLDEISLHGITHVAELYRGQIENYVVSPDDFGVESCSLASISCGATEDAIQSARCLLSGRGTTEQKNFVAVNCAAALYLAGVQPDLKAGTAAALEVMSKGLPMQLLEKLAEASNQFDEDLEISNA